MEFYTPEEVATRLKLSRRTVYRWLRSGKIKAVKLAGATLWRIPESELQRLLGGSEEEERRP